MIKNKKINDPIRNWVKDLTRHLSQRRYMDDEHIKRSSMWLAIRERLFKTTKYIIWVKCYHQVDMLRYKSRSCKLELDGSGCGVGLQLQLQFNLYLQVPYATNTAVIRKKKKRIRWQKENSSQFDNYWFIFCYSKTSYISFTSNLNSYYLY